MGFTKEFVTPGHKLRKLLVHAPKSTLARCLWSEASRPIRDLPGCEDPARVVYGWLCRAQDATPDGGVSKEYSLTSGWASSYPETTGYLIPTFLSYAQERGVADARWRALEMAAWEIAVALPSGAVRSGADPNSERPAVFNTGQVLQGWVAAHQAEPREDFARAARRAADWLVEQQDDDGAWRRNLSALVSKELQTWNVRTAWALVQYGQAFDSESHVRAGILAAAWAQAQRTPSGWFCHTSFDARPPLLHTVAYVLEGLLELGMATERREFVDAAEEAARCLLRDYVQRWELAGRYDDGWRPSGRSRCLTGEAQVALVWLRLAEITGDVRWKIAAGSLLRTLLRTMILDGGPAEIRGGLKGSEPIYGDYSRWRYPNWAAKFLLDALLLSERRGVDLASLARPSSTGPVRRFWVETAKPALRPMLKRVRTSVPHRREAPAGIGSPEALSSRLRALGVGLGRVVMVHASMDALHRWCPTLDPKAMTNLLLELIGADGTLLMPTFPFSGKQLDYLLVTRTFHVQRTPSRLGLLSEAFRRRRGVVRSRHPTHSVAALGRQAQELVSDPVPTSTFGPGSPFHRLYEGDGLVVGLGVGLFQGYTVLHTAEVLHPRIRNIVVAPDPLTCDVSDGDWSGEVEVHTLRRDVRRNLKALEASLLSRGVLTYDSADGFLLSSASAYAFVEESIRCMDQGIYAPEIEVQ